MRRTFLIVCLSLIGLRAFASPHGEERLFCGVCGKHNELVATFCFNCGSRLDKSALIARLKARLAIADSLKQSVVFAPAEISVLVREEAEARARELIRSGVKLPLARPKTQAEKTLDVVVPIVVGATVIFFVRQALYP